MVWDAADFYGPWCKPRRDHRYSIGTVKSRGIKPPHVSVAFVYFLVSAYVSLSTRTTRPRVGAS